MLTHARSQGGGKLELPILRLTASRSNLSMKARRVLSSILMYNYFLRLTHSGPLSSVGRGPSSPRVLAQAAFLRISQDQLRRAYTSLDQPRPAFSDRNQLKAAAASAAAAADSRPGVGQLVLNKMWRLSMSEILPRGWHCLVPTEFSKQSSRRHGNRLA